MGARLRSALKRLLACVLPAPEEPDFFRRGVVYPSEVVNGRSTPYVEIWAVVASVNAFAPKDPLEDVRVRMNVPGHGEVIAYARGARIGVAANWADALGGPAGFQNPNDAGINQRDALLALMTSMQAQGDQARANARRAIAGEVADLTRLREELAEGIWKMTQDPQRAAAPAKLAEDRRRLEVIDKRVERLFDQIAADAPPAPAPAPVPPVRMPPVLAPGAPR